MKQLLYILQFIWSAGINLVFRTLPSYLVTYVPSAFLIGMVHTAYSISRLLSTPCGMGSDKFGKRRTMLTIFIALPFIALAFTISNSVWHFALMFFIVGLLANFYYSSSNALITIFFKKRLQSLFSMEAMYQLGFMVGPVLGGFLTLQYGIETAFYTWAGLGVIGIILSAILFRKKEQPPEKKKYSGFWDSLKKNKLSFFVFLFIGGGLTGFMEAIQILGLPLYATSLGMTIYEVGILFGISSAISFVGFLYLGRKLDKMKKETSLTFSIILMSAPFFLFALFQDIITLAILSGVFTLGRAGGLNIARAFMSDNTAASSRAGSMAFVDTLLFIGRIVGPIFGGLVIDFINIPFLFFTSGIISAASLILVAIYVVYKRI